MIAWSIKLLRFLRFFSVIAHVWISNTDSELCLSVCHSTFAYARYAHWPEPTVQPATQHSRLSTAADVLSVRVGSWQTRALGLLNCRRTKSEAGNIRCWSVFSCRQPCTDVWCRAVKAGIHTRAWRADIGGRQLGPSGPTCRKHKMANKI